MENIFGYYFLTISMSPIHMPAASNVPGFDAENKGRAQMTNLGLTTIFHNNGVNDFRFTYLRLVNQLGLRKVFGVSLSSLGLSLRGAADGGIDA